MAFTTEVDQLAKELSWLRQEFDGIKGVVNGWTGGAGTDPYFQYLRARDGFFDRPILESAMVRRTSSQTIPNNAFTAVNWEEVTVNSGLISLSTITNSTRVNVSPISAQQDQLIWFSGYLDWDTASTAGIRSVQLQTYRPDGTSIGGFRFEESSGSGAGAVGLPWILPLRHNSSNGFLTLEVMQDSGGDLGLRQARIAVLRTF